VSGGLGFWEGTLRLANKRECTAVYLSIASLEKCMLSALKQDDAK